MDGRAVIKILSTVHRERGSGGAGSVPYPGGE